MRRVQLLNGEFDPLTLNESVETIFHMLSNSKRGWICTVNVAILMMMRSDPWLQRFVEKAALVVADGQPIVWCVRWFGQFLPERVTGVDLIDAICERAANEGKRIYLLGASHEIIAKVAKRLKSRHQGLLIKFDNGYFAKNQGSSRAIHIREFRTDILLVGMGVPKQEYFIEDQWDHLGASIAIGVGGSFDVLAGLRTRAPKWIQKTGMEWFFRLAQEPRRLFMRYLATNVQFVWLIACAVLDKFARRRT